MELGSHVKRNAITTSDGGGKDFGNAPFTICKRMQKTETDFISIS